MSHNLLFSKTNNEKTKTFKIYELPQYSLTVFDLQTKEALLSFEFLPEKQEKTHKIFFTNDPNKNENMRNVKNNFKLISLYDEEIFKIKVTNYTTYWYKFEFLNEKNEKINKVDAVGPYDNIITSENILNGEKFKMTKAKNKDGKFVTFKEKNENKENDANKVGDKLKLIITCENKRNYMETFFSVHTIYGTSKSINERQLHVVGLEELRVVSGSREMGIKAISSIESQNKVITEVEKEFIAETRKYMEPQSKELGELELGSDLMSITPHINTQMKIEKIEDVKKDIVETLVQSALVANIVGGGKIDEQTKPVYITWSNTSKNECSFDILISYQHKIIIDEYEKINKNFAAQYFCQKFENNENWIIEMDLQQPKKNDECCVCLTTKIELRFLPCSHACTCEECYKKFDSNVCPLCRSPISFLSFLSEIKQIKSDDNGKEKEFHLQYGTNHNSNEHCCLIF